MAGVAVVLVVLDSFHGQAADVLKKNPRTTDDHMASAEVSSIAIACTPLQAGCDELAAV